MVFSALSANELDMIEAYIRRYAPFSNSAIHWEKMAPLNVILAPWAENKGQYLYELMGHQLIIETEINYEKDHRMLMTEMMETLVYPHSPDLVEFQKAWLKMIEDHIEKLEAVDEKASWVLHQLIVNATILADNKWDGMTHYIQLPNSVFRLQTGTKVMRAVGKIAKAYGIPKFQEFCNAHSLILNQKKLRGTLCISIHPLDYMTMSDNQCDWSSCMSWTNEGGYRHGTVEMMNSPCVVVAYLKAKEDMKLDDTIVWNNKKWRELFIVSRDIITGVLGYPYRNDDLTKAVLDVLKGLAEKNCGYKYRDNLYTRSYWFYDDSYIFKDEQGKPFVDFSFNTHYMYNDTAQGMQAYIVDSIHESQAKENSMIRKIVPSRNDTEIAVINYSGPSECMICGKTDIVLDDESTLYCKDCGDDAVCDCCGREIYRNLFYVIDGKTLCLDCYSKRVAQCALCGKEHMIDGEEEQFETVEVRLTPDSINTYKKLYICKKCFRKEDVEKNLLKAGQHLHYTAFKNFSTYWTTIDKLNEVGLYTCFQYDPTRKSFSEWRTHMFCKHKKMMRQFKMAGNI